MVGIDTNLLVRYITQDGKEASSATAYLEANCTAETPGFISHIVLCELVWVLARAYKYKKAEITRIIEKVFTVAEFEVQQPDLAWRALHQYRTESADFSDFLLAQVAREHDAVPVATLDKKASRSSDFVLVEEGER